MYNHRHDNVVIIRLHTSYDFRNHINDHNFISQRHTFSYSIHMYASVGHILTCTYRYYMYIHVLVLMCNRYFLYMLLSCMYFIHHELSFIIWIYDLFIITIRTVIKIIIIKYHKVKYC